MRTRPAELVKQEIDTRVDESRGVRSVGRAGEAVAVVVEEDEVCGRKVRAEAAG